jgi:sensor histidine kinase YesM
MSTTSIQQQEHVFISWRELIFFVVYFVVFPILSGLQYTMEFKGRDDFSATAIYFVASGVLNIVPYYFYYKVIVTRFLFARKYLSFAVAVLLFLVVFDLYIRYVIDLGIAHMSFLPDSVQKMAANAFKSNRWLRQSLTYTLMNLISVTALAYFIRNRQKERQVQQLQQQQLQMELEALKAQLHPHFFFNTLNNIYSLALQRSAATAPVVEKLADMMRYILYRSHSTTIPLQQEIGFISNYIALEKIRHDDKIRISFDFQGQPDGIVTAPFLLLPFIENAFKHGIDNETGEGFVEIVIVAEIHELVLSIKNSKPALNHAVVHKERGVGLPNIQKRLSLLYAGKHTLQVVETEELYSVYLTIPLTDALLPDR